MGKGRFRRKRTKKCLYFFLSHLVDVTVLYIKMKNVPVKCSVKWYDGTAIVKSIDRSRLRLPLLLFFTSIWMTCAPITLQTRLLYFPNLYTAILHSLHRDCLTRCFMIIFPQIEFVRETKFGQKWSAESLYHALCLPSPTASEHVFCKCKYL